MHLPRLAAAVASLASAAAATASSPDLRPLPRGILLDARALSPDDIKCHKTCGNAIQGATKAGYCDDTAWRQLQQRCSECASAQDGIAVKYHDALKTALEPCGLEAPSLSAAGAQATGAGSSSGAHRSTSVASVQPTSTAQESSAAATGTTSGVTSSAPSAATSASSASATGGVQAGVSSTARASSASSGDAARGSQAIPLGRLAVLVAAAMLR